jgi:peptidoglycan/xylan/chitin deacetylase (PgdA/CDA1 family)
LLFPDDAPPAPGSPEKDGGTVKFVLICHASEPLNRYALAQWLAAEFKLAGLVVIEEGPSSLKRRAKFEIKRIGYARFLDVMAFRAYYSLGMKAADARREAELLAELTRRYPPIPDSVPIFRTASPNSPETRKFLEEVKPDAMIARCKVILKPEIFEIPRIGTFVMHPGICPEYRNAHGCFWALAQNDRERVGMTLLKVDRGIDTGPVYGYFRCRFDEKSESHISIQNRTVFDNLPEIAAKFREIEAGNAALLDTKGRKSAVWGQPWLSAHVRIQRNAPERPKIVTLLYHDVLSGQEKSGFSGADADSYKLDRDDFANHLAALSSGGTVFEALKDEPAALFDRTAPLSLITFDDGGESAHSAIAPMLEERGHRGVFFIPTQYIGQPGFMSEEQIRDLDRRGHTIGSHSHSHPARISALPYDEIVAEWKTSIAILERILGKKVVTGSVPGGFYSEQVDAAAREAGIQCLFTSEPLAAPARPGATQLFGRYGIKRGDSPEKAAKLLSQDPVLTNGMALTWNGKKLLKRIGGDTWLRFRHWYFDKTG